MIAPLIHHRFKDNARAIAALNLKLKIGLAFSCQQVPHVPFESHDERLDRIVTELG